MTDFLKLGKGITGALTKAKELAQAEKPMVNRLDMNFKDVTKRVPELTEAANMLARGEITAAQYDALVTRLKPVTPYSFVPAPATTEDAMRALTENKKPMFGKTGEMSAGEQADLRLDIPAYKDHGVWVNSIHRKDQPTVYGSTSSVKNATMIGAPDKALKVAQGGPKAPFAVIRGDWSPMSEEAAVAKAQEYLDHPDWKQVGYDPERHGYFYDRASMEPVQGAEEVIQIGPLVLAKKPTYGKKSEEKYVDGGKVAKGIVGALAKAREAAQAQKDLRVYHGSPHRMAPAPDNPLGKFDSSRAGTGEGGSAYGTGHYLAQAKDVAKTYRQNKPEAGGLYHVDLPKEHIDNMLDWDKPMKNHPPHIKQKLDDWQWSQIEAEAAKRNMSPYDFEKEVSMTGRLPPTTGGGISGDQYYSALAEYLGGRDKASKALQEMGIPGIKYYDEASRPMGGWEVGKSADGKWLLKNHGLSSNQWKEFPSEQEAISAYNAIPDTGTRNFVVFHGNEDMAKIVDREKKGGVIHMADAGRVGKGIVGALTKAMEIAKAKKGASKIDEVLASQTPPMTTPQGTGLPLMPRDNGMYTLREQKDLPRMPMVDKARAEGKSPKYNERMQDLLDSPKARKKVDNLINKGKELKIQEWYGTEPLRQVALDAGRTPEQFDSMMAQLASASQRNPVDKQNQMGSYLYHLSETGQLPENSMLLTNKLKEALKADPSLAQGRTLVELPKGYGSLAQGDIFNRAVMIGQGNIGEALPPNKKLGTFYENLLGNLKPVTVDVNALRGPIIEQGDPRWLTSKLVEKDEKGKVINSYKPREMYNTGEMSMREAQQRPGFWEAAPSGSEYAGFEELWKRGAKRHDVEPAEAQALGWYGSGVPKEGDNITALKTKPENYVDNLERLIKYTAEQTGKSPSEVMNDMVTGKGFLRKDGGKVEKPDWHLAVEQKIKDDGYSFVESPKRMSDGGPPDEGAAFGVYRKPKGGEDIRRGGKETGEVFNILGDMVKEQSSKEVESLGKNRASTDLLNRGVLANNPLSVVIDMINMGLVPLDVLGSKLTGRDIKVSSDKPFLGSEYVKDLMNQYGVTSGEERPMMELGLGLLGPNSIIKGAQKTADLAKKAPEAFGTVRGGLETMSANAQRPFRPATLTMEAVAPDLGQKSGDKFKDLVTKRMISGEGAPVNMERMGGRKTEQTMGQGLYENFAKQLETNPMVGVTIPRAGNLSTNKQLIADIGTAGQELGQEMVAAHKFTPLMFKNPKDATAMMIGGSEPLTKDQIRDIYKFLPGMIVTHSPKNNSMFVAPFEGDALDYKKAAQAASEILGKGAKVQFGKADSKKDIMFRGDYDKMEARPPSAESTEMRNRLKKAEARIVRGPSVSQSGRQSQPATLTSTVR